MTIRNLITSIANHQVESVRELIKNIDINQSIPQEELNPLGVEVFKRSDVTFLHLAAYYGNQDIVNIIVNAKANINAKCESKYSKKEFGGLDRWDVLPRHYALTAGNEDIAISLLHRENSQKLEKINQDISNLNNQLEKESKQHTLSEFEKQEYLFQIENVEEIIEQNKAEQASNDLELSQNVLMIPVYGGKDKDENENEQKEKSPEIQLEKLKDLLAEVTSTLQTQKQTIQKMQDQIKELEIEKRRAEQIRIMTSEAGKQTIFFNSFRVKLQRLINAYCNLSTDLFARERNTVAKAIGLTIEITGNLVPLPGADLIALLASKGLEEKADSDQSKAIKKILNVFRYSVGQMETIIDNVAIKLAETYVGQIMELTDKGADQLAQAGIWRIIECLREGLLLDEEYNAIEGQLLSAIDELMPEQIALEGSINLETTDKKISPWTDEGVFQRSGIKSKENSYYTNAHSLIWLYQWRKATSADATRLGMSLVPNNQVVDLEVKPQQTTPTIVSISEEQRKNIRYKFFKRLPRLANLGEITPEGQPKHDNKNKCTIL